MATEQYFQEAAISPDFKDCKSLSSSVDDSETNSSGDFECNICLDVVKDPVITFCGHLYCWPCIYRWITFPNTSSENPDELQKPQCPVCKAEVSEKTLIPLYGRGQTTNSSKDKVSEHGTVVPKRPFSPSRTFPEIRHQSYIQSSSQPYNPHPGAYTGSSMIGIGGTATNSIDPMVGMIGEMVYTRFFGNEETLFTYPDSYRLASSSSRRMRRRIMQTDRSLGRVCFFLWWCVILCLLLF